jgi:hypothetical protein
MQNKGRPPAVELEGNLANPGPGGRAARHGRDEAIRRKTSPRSRAFCGAAGGFVCKSAAVGL